MEQPNKFISWKSNQTMNQKINKFRAWDEKQQYMAYQGTPDLETIQSFMFHFGDNPLMQYINSNDNGNIQLFEDDIVEWSGIAHEGTQAELTYCHICQIVFDNIEFGGWVLKSFSETDLGVVPIGKYGANPKELKLLGNIYENKNLIPINPNLN